MLPSALCPLPWLLAFPVPAHSHYPSWLCCERPGAVPYIECPRASFQHHTNDGDLDGNTCREAEPRSPPCREPPEQLRWPIVPRPLPCLWPGYMLLLPPFTLVCLEMNFSSRVLRGISTPYLPWVPSSTRMKWE